MRLKEAITTYLSDQAVYTGAVYDQDAHGTDTVLVLTEVGVHRREPTRFRAFPVINILLRGPSTARETTEVLANAIHAALDLVGPCTLATGYRVSHIECDGRPIPLGRDAAGNWSWAINVDVTVPPNLQI